MQTIAKAEPIVEYDAALAEIERLKGANARLRERELKAYGYVREKVNQLLAVMGTLPLGADELDDETLLASDPIGTVGESFRMILEHLHHTNDRLTLASEEIRAILDSAGAGILVVDHEGRIVSLNHKVKELFAARREQILGRACREVICRADARPPVCVLDEVLSTGRDECRADWRSGDRDFEVAGTPIRNAQGAITHVVIVYTEITSRKRTEAALRQALADAREARDRIDGILQSVDDGLLVTDPEQRIVLMNPRAEVLLGTCLADAGGLPLAEVVTDAGLLGAIGRALVAGEAGRVDFTLPGGEGENGGIFEGRISVLRNTEGEPCGTVVIMRDVTQERAVERMKSEFVTTAAHEFRTPLTAIMGFSELMLDPECSAGGDHQEFLRLIHEKAEGLAGIVNNLLDVSRIESGEQLLLNRSPCLLHELLGAVVPAFEKRCNLHTFARHLPDRPILLDVDQGAIEQVFDNILGNAVKYSPAGGTIRIECRIANGFCQVDVADQGVGMTRQQAARAFDKFYRADSSNTAIRGTGLGMTIVRYIIEAHGCRVWLDSVKGMGTTVHFTLPLAEEAHG